MHSTLSPKLSDDPHDIVVVAPDAIRVAPAEQELASLLHEAAARHFSNPPTARLDSFAVASVPPVDTTFRPPADSDAVVAGAGPSMGRRALRAVVTLLLAGCIGLAALVWRTYGDTVKKQVAKLTTEFVLTSSLPPDNPAPSAPTVAADAANAAPPPAQSAAQAAAPAAAIPSADSVQSMARDLASMGQQMEQLKASIEQLKTNQQQASRDIARVSEAKASAARPSEPNARPRNPATIAVTSPPPARPAEAHQRKPAPPPSQAVAPAQATALPPPQAPAPYYASRQPDYAPRQIAPPPQVMAEPPPLDPELTPVPRPPMPLPLR